MHKNEFSLERMSKVFKVSRSGYYKFMASRPSVREVENKRLAEAIRGIHKASREMISIRPHQKTYQ